VPSVSRTWAWCSSRSTVAAAKVKVRRRRGRTTIRIAGIRSAPDLVERDFNPTEPDRLYCADITVLRTWEGWRYLASVMDCYSRRIVGWAIADHLRAELVIDALQMAVARRRPDTALAEQRFSLGRIGCLGQVLERHGFRSPIEARQHLLRQAAIGMIDLFTQVSAVR
jgi:transposase InsO family protein